MQLPAAVSPMAPAPMGAPLGWQRHSGQWPMLGLMARGPWAAARTGHSSSGGRDSGPVLLAAQHPLSSVFPFVSSLLVLCRLGTHWVTVAPCWTSCQ